MFSLILDKIQDFQEFYSWILTKADTRVENWFLMSSCTPTLVLSGLYLFLVHAGMRLMKNREAFQLKTVLIIYNFALVLLNLHISIELITAPWTLGYSFTCQPVNYSYDYNEMRIARALYWYYLSKLIEFLDTFFFVLRKKNNQVSFLHLYHHATMFPIWWIGVKWVAGGQSFFGASINSSVHVVMYTYYGIAGLGPQYQKYLWWKKYLTKLQLFAAGLLYGFNSLYTGCKAVPIGMQRGAVVYGFTITALFINFYFQAYINKKPNKIQFVMGMYHAAQSLWIECAFPKWMQYALIIYGSSILGLFLNFYFHAYIKSVCRLKADKPTTNGYSNGHAVSNGHIANGDTSRRSKKVQ